MKKYKWFTISKVLDFITTIVGLRMGLQETNGIVSSILSHTGYIGLILAFAGLVAFYRYVELKYRSRLTSFVLWVYLIITYLIVINNTILLTIVASH